MKKALSLILAVVLVLSFTACDTSTAPVAPSSEAPASEAPTSEAPASEAPASEGKVTIKWPSIWVGTDSKAEAMSGIVAEFNTMNEGKIEVIVEEISDYQGYRDKIRTSITAGSAPDIFIMDQDISVLLDESKLLDLTPYMDEAFLANMKPGFIEKGTKDGKVLALPYEMAAIPIYYNQDLLTAAGVAEIPKTFEEHMAAAEKLKANGTAPFSQMTGENGWTSMLWFSYLLAAHGGKDVMQNPDDPAWVAAAEDLVKMFGDNTTLDAVGAGAAVSGGHYLNGETAMFTNGTWYFPRLQNDGIEGLYDNTTIAPGFAVEGGKGEAGYMVGAVQAYFMIGKTDDTTKADATVQFLKFLCEPQNINKIAQASGALFTFNTDFQPDTRLSTDVYGLLDKAPYVVDHFNASQPQSVVLAFPQELDSLILGEKTPQEFVDALKAARQA